MKNALILHGTDADHSHNWFPWLKTQLEALGWVAWVPDLPGADAPNIERYNAFLIEQLGQAVRGGGFEKRRGLNGDSVIIGHSSGAVEILGLLNEIALAEPVAACFLVGVFRGDLGWDNLKGMNADFDFEVIKTKSRKFVFIHSDNDPYCPLEHAEYLSMKLGGKLIFIPGQGHFTTSLDPSYTKFPKLLEIIKQEV